MNFDPTSFIAGNASLRAFALDGLIHPVKPIAQLIPFSIYNLQATKIQRVVFPKNINYSLSTYSFRADIQADDNLTPTDGTIGRGQSAAIELYIIEEERVIEHIIINFNSYPSGQLNPLVIDTTKSFDVKASTDINRLTFFCEPVYLLPAIDIVNPFEVEDNRR